MKASWLNYCVMDVDTRGQEAIHPVTTVILQRRPKLG